MSLTEMQEGFEQPVKEISVQDMDRICAEYREAKTKASEAQKVADELKSIAKEKETQIIRMLEESGKTTYIAEGVGRATIKHHLSVKTPKTIDELRAFFGWVKENLGQDVHDSYMTVNSQALNGLYKDLSAQWQAKGEVLQIDGLSEPIASTALSFTKA
jgi:predicted unusual protein kinase regulating ubiquinone biosynthesis (AarF/ABC1/UbiB family)